MRLLSFPTLALLLAASGLDAQAHDPQAHAGHAQHASGYAELMERDIKALSAEDVEGLLAGAGMAQALPAELNGWAGPRHVLEMADMLGLTEEQRAGVQAVFDEMDREARRLGAEVVEAERELDRYFLESDPSPQGLAQLTTRVAELRGQLRFTHLKAHLQTNPLLTEAQRAHYQMARGYRGG